MVKKKQKFDMSYLPFPKGSRIVNPKVYEEVHLDYCEYCGKAGRTEKHHIIFRSHGGPDEEWNIVNLCRKCHRRAHGTIEPKLTIKDIVRRVRRLRNDTHWEAEYAHLLS